MLQPIIHFYFSWLELVDVRFLFILIDRLGIKLKQA